MTGHYLGEFSMTFVRRLLPPRPPPPPRSPLVRKTIKMLTPGLSGGKSRCCCCCRCRLPLPSAHAATSPSATVALALVPPTTPATSRLSKRDPTGRWGYHDSLHLPVRPVRSCCKSSGKGVGRLRAAIEGAHGNARKRTSPSRPRRRLHASALVGQVQKRAVADVQCWRKAVGRASSCNRHARCAPPRLVPSSAPRKAAERARQPEDQSGQQPWETGTPGQATEVWGRRAVRLAAEEN